MMNRMMLQGRFCADPELRRTNSGTAVASFRLAWSETVKERETQLFLPCVAWGSTGEMICKYFRKGKEVLVEGRMSTRSWEDQSGQKRSTTELTVERVHFCGPKEQGAQQSAPAENFPVVDDDEQLPF